MKQLLLTVFTILLIGGIVKAQQLTPTTISSGGSSKLAGGVLLEDNVGGFIVNTISTPTFMYTQGFIQPDAGTTIIVPHINDVVLNSGSGLDNAGTTFINGNIMLEFTVGEVASNTLFGGTNMLTQGILQPYNSTGALPVTGLEFYAKRINNTTVQLDWKTLQEINNKGFHIERKKENESNFTDMGFVNSLANGGNSSLPLQYQKPDNNDFTGSTYYRLKQVDIDGGAAYSVVRLVKGDATKQLTMQVWPVPAVGFFTVNVNGLDKPDAVQVIDMTGRLVKQFAIQNNTQQQVNGLPAGTYFIKLAGDKTVGQKVIVQ
jgi:hypothetical protein